MQEAVERREKELVYSNRMSAQSCSKAHVGVSFRYWNKMNARSCGGARGKATYETKWMQEVEKHIGGKGKVRY